METKHTPGPWSFVPSIPEHGCECFWIENGVQKITAIDGPQNEEQEANARLIAAAPELLESLLMILGSDVTVLGIDEFNNAKVAIAKATGASHE